MHFHDVHFGAGGIRGYYTATVYSKMVKDGIGPAGEISGASVGAIIAACTCSQTDKGIPDAISVLRNSNFVPHQNVCQKGYNAWSAFTGRQPAYASNKHLVHAIENAIGRNATVQVPRFSIGVTDANTLQQVRLTKHQGDKIDAREVAASCSIPFVFPPVRIHNNVYIDGGIQRSFVRESVINSLQNSTTKYVLLFGCSPWSGHFKFAHAPTYDATSILMRVGRKRWYENIGECTLEYLSIVRAKLPPDNVGRFIVLHNTNTQKSTVITSFDNACADAKNYDKVLICVAPTPDEFARFMDASIADSPRQRAKTMGYMHKCAVQATDEINTLMRRCGVTSLASALDFT